MLIYAITNLLNGKRYIGMTEQSLRERWSQHKLAAKNGVDTALYFAIRKYGHESFSVEPIAMVMPGMDRKTLCEIERLLIAQEGTRAPNGYNMTEGGDGLPAGPSNPNLGRKATEEHKAKVAATWTAEKRAYFAKMRAERNRVMNKKPEHGQKIAHAWTPERRAAQAERMRNHMKTRVETPEQKAARIAWLVAATKSEEGRARMSVRSRKMMNSPEVRAQYSQRLKNRWAEHGGLQ